MPTNRSRLKALALLVLMGAGGVFAQDDAWYSDIRLDRGPGNSSLGFRGSLPIESRGSAGPDSTALGYRFTDILAIEGTQASYGLNGPACGGGDMPAGDARSCYGSALSLAGIATFGSGLSLYGRLGLKYRQKQSPDGNSASVRRSLDDVGGVLGVGISYELTRALTFHAESERYSDLFTGTAPGPNLGLDASVHSIGLSIKF